MRTLLSTGLLAALVAAGCGGDGETAAPPDAVTETEVVTETETAAETGSDGPEARRCENGEAGYAVEFPADWHVNPGDVAGPCTLFDPEPIGTPEATDEIQFAISLGREPAPFDVVAAEGPARTVLEREELDVGGNPAVRLEFESTGEGLLAPGTRGYQYVIAVGDESIVATTYDVGDFDYERNREVLDAMIESLVLTS